MEIEMKAVEKEASISPKECSPTQKSLETISELDKMNTEQTFGHLDAKFDENIEEKKILYYSDFEINVNEWFTEYENIAIFKINVKKLLGKTRIPHFLFEIGETWNKLCNSSVRRTEPESHKNKDIFTIATEFYLITNGQYSVSSIFSFINPFHLIRIFHYGFHFFTNYIEI